MSKRVKAKHKIDRRLGVNLWGCPNSPYITRNYAPGQHGQRRKRKLSDYGSQLHAKQKLRGYYGNITEKQFRRIYSEAVRINGDTGENLVGLLESRLDSIIYRMNFVTTVFAARQFVNHGHLLVNDKFVNIPSYKVCVGDIIEVRPCSKKMSSLLDSIKSTEREVPDYIKVDHKIMKGSFLRIPLLSDVPYPIQMEPNLVVEFYSR